jgi:hypothetical protein
MLGALITIALAVLGGGLAARAGLVAAVPTPVDPVGGTP